MAAYYAALMQSSGTTGRLSDLIIAGAARKIRPQAVVAQLVEHVLGKDEVKGSSPFNSYAARATVSGL